MMTVGMLTRDLPNVRLSGDADRPVIDVTVDSRAVAENWMFAALTGACTNGRHFVADAAGRGASAVLGQGDRPAALPERIAWLDAVDPRASLAEVARRLHGAPDEDLAVVGITGTDGKTTTAHLLSAALDGAGWPSGTGGTLGQRFREVERETALTTPEAPELYRFLEQSRRDGARAVVLEVSSAGLAAKRTEGMRFAAAGLTGIGHDHLDLHGTLEAYASAKRRLFEGLGRDAVAVLPAEDPWTESFRRACPAERIETFGSEPGADWIVGEPEIARDRSSFEFAGPGLPRRRITWARTAPWDARNLAAAVALACAVGADPEAALSGAQHAGPVPGRWERIQRGQPFTVVVDYAHTPPALERALRAARTECAARVLLVFGCGGDRDRAKRPLMGRIAAERADVAIVTDDNPRGEDPEAIATEIMTGAGEGGAWMERVADRGEAIAMAVSLAGEGDLVLIAGRGHERLQKIGDRLVPFDDRRAVVTALERGEVRP
jgi:UDP-N-acetylmuramoyl-L-alanyl-D-glutamate--2,6-diaminopimelate ligase